MKEQNDIADKKIDKLAVDIYEDIVKTTNKLPGDVAAGTGARGAYVCHFQDAWADVYNAKGTTEATKEIMKGLGTRAEALVKGVPFGKTWKFDRQKKVMAAALVASHIAMKTAAEFQKYETCGSGTMCLHFPSFFGDDNNMAYELDEAVKSERAGLVMSRYPGGGTMRFYAMSPCKTDYVVEAHGKDGTCKCDEYRKGDKVYFKVKRVTCPAYDVNRIRKRDAITLDSAPINPDLTCPSTFPGLEDISTVIVDVIKLHDGSKVIECDTKDGDVYECAEDFFYRMCEDGEEPDRPDDPGCLHDEYRNCFISPSSDSERCINPDKFHNRYKNVMAVAVNGPPDTQDGDITPITTCRNSWWGKMVHSTEEKYQHPCITVDIDIDSLRGYSKDGFGYNFCGENKEQFTDKLENACFWGGVTGSTIALLCATSAAGAIVVPTVIESAAIVCEHFLNEKSKWPHDQY